MYVNCSPITLIKRARTKGMGLSQIATLLQLRSALKDCSSVLDVGCGPDSALSLFGFERLVGIEGYASSVEAAKKNKTHQDVILGDVRSLDQYFNSNQFDACVALDVIEHLIKADGFKLMNAMENVSKKKAVFLTPNGFLPQRHAEKSDLQEHLSGWETSEMRERGYQVTGVLGPKSLRGEYHKLKKAPAWFWGIVSLLGHVIYTRTTPERAAALLCVKVK